MKRYLLLFLLFCPIVSFPQIDTLRRAPIIGIPTNQDVPVLIKGIDSGRVRLQYRQAGQLDVRDSTAWYDLVDVHDFTTAITLPALDPQSIYEYRVEFEGGSTTPWYSFKTFPESGVPEKFDFIFSACFRVKNQPHPIFDHIKDMAPVFVALLGDNMYADYDGDVNAGADETRILAFRTKYDRNLEEHFQTLSSSIPIMAIWDDHDYGRDNSDGTYPYKEEAKQVFKETFPPYPYETEEGGLYYRFSVADVDFFVLDTRWYRTPMQATDGPEKTMLGETQLAWLLNGLRNSRALFKIVFSSVSLNDYGGDTSSGRLGLDNWAGYLFERELIMAHLAANNLKGVLFFSGDQHYPSANILNWSQLPEAVESTDSSAIYSLSEVGNAVFDFSASPFNYKRAGGSTPYDHNPPDPRYSFEIYRAPWAYPGVIRTSASTAVYGYAAIDTKSQIPSITVSFHEMDSETMEINELYKVVVRSDRTVNLKPTGGIQTGFKLYGNYPNPFNSVSTIRFDLPQASDVSLVVYDILGREVARLVDGYMEAGYHQVQWNGGDRLGGEVPSGIYIAQLMTPEYTNSIKMLLLK